MRQKLYKTYKKDCKIRISVVYFFYKNLYPFDKTEELSVQFSKGGTFMKKRYLALFISACMLVSMPAITWAEEAAAEETTEETVTEETVTEETTEEAVTEEEAGPEATEGIGDIYLTDEGVTGTIDDFDVQNNDLVILFTNDMHGGISADKDYSGSDKSLGFAGLAGVKDDMTQKAGSVVTVDLGDAIQGSVVTTETDGKCVMDMMDAVGYDIRIPGNHEFDYGMEAFLEYAQNNGTFLSSNFIDLRTGEAIFPGYKVVDYVIGDKAVKIGFVGMSTPETIAKSTPTYFQDEEGNFIYGFDDKTPQDLYANIQGSIDACYKEGADFVIGLGHMGDTDVEKDWSSLAVIANTSGMIAFLDAHSHNVIPGKIVNDMNGEPVVLASTGTKLENIGVLKISAEDGDIVLQTGLIDKLTDEEYKTFGYSSLDEMVQAVEEEFAYLFVKVGETPYDLVIYDPETGDRIVRLMETNLGDFLADAYREELKADIGVINGGSIRANIDAGDITYMEIISVFPWNTAVSLVEVPGQVILDMLEMGAHLYPEQCGGFIQVSGMTYTIDASVPSSVNVNSDGEFVSVDGDYRVKDVMVGDKPLDLKKTYKLAINTYYSKDFGDGMNMFKDCKILVPAEGEEDIIDHDVIIDHLAHINDKVPEDYKDPYGQGRVTITGVEEASADEAA